MELNQNDFVTEGLSAATIFQAAGTVETETADPQEMAWRVQYLSAPCSLIV